MSDLTSRIASFMVRFNASREQARSLLGIMDAVAAEEAEKWIARRIMQDDAYKYIGYGYTDRDPEYMSGKNRNDAYQRVMLEMTADLIDEVYHVMPKNSGAGQNSRNTE
jgi:hypothetical protein